MNIAQVVTDLVRKDLIGAVSAAVSPDQSNAETIGLNVSGEARVVRARRVGDTAITVTSKKFADPSHQVSTICGTPGTNLRTVSDLG